MGILTVHVHGQRPPRVCMPCGRFVAHKRACGGPPIHIVCIPWPCRASADYEVFDAITVKILGQNVIGTITHVCSRVRVVLLEVQTRVCQEKLVGQIKIRPARCTAHCVQVVHPVAIKIATRMSDTRGVRIDGGAAFVSHEAPLPISEKQLAWKICNHDVQMSVPVHWRQQFTVSIRRRQWHRNERQKCGKIQ